MHSAALQQLNNELDTILEDQPRLDAKMNTLQNIVPSLQLVMRDAQQLYSVISKTSDLAERVSSKVRLLDSVKSRVQESMKRVDDILDLKACVNGVQTALNTGNYEQAAAHIHRYLSLDRAMIENIIGDKNEGSDLSGAFVMLQEAEEKLKAIVQQEFDQAISKGDRSSVERFFKIFPLLNQHAKGLGKYSHYLCSMVAATAQQNLEQIDITKDSDRHANVLFANTLTMLFEGIARMVEEHQPFVETYYGPGQMPTLLQILQVECDKQADQILDAFVKRRDLQHKIKSVTKSLNIKGSSEKSERYDPRDMEVLLGEVVLMNTRTEMYLRFLEKKIQADYENLPDEDVQECADVNKVLDKLINNSGVNRRMQELIGSYITMEEYFMRETAMKAVKMDYYEGEPDEAVTSSMVDDVFFIVQKSVRRSLSSSCVDAVCAMLNHASSLLSSEYCDVLKTKVKAGFPTGGLDLSGMFQGKIQVASTAESEAGRKAFLVILNNLEVSSENIQKLKKYLEAECERNPNLGDAAKMKLESCLSDLVSTANIFKDLLQEGICHLCANAVMPRLKPLIDGFSSISHNISEEEFSYYEVNDPFIQNFITHLDSVLTSFKGPLTTSNYDSLVSYVATDITALVEKAVIKTNFNRLGGLQLDKELRSLVGYLTAVTQWTIRDKFARLTQISTLLNLEKVSEIMDYWGANSGPLTWRLTPAEVRQVLALRIDFRSEDINRLKL
ncbi:conserved oligomeric Golgi complex subunit 4 isoform X2 [Nematostella vectensis]|uniref:conserved oligomeric Golgi complex subunit 4 isoform X2 n=1 Tax=Nematostella vectensis TaxID=45351 RepID=UPI00139052B5|nr:conserved oligomeric Golgi complex subunit 4 isoform X2 [Nematostella vectensis]